jgi:hypothetical protein
VDALYCNNGLIERGLDLAGELKLLVMLSAYEQMDAVLARLGALLDTAEGLGPDEAEDLRAQLAPPPDSSTGVDLPGLAGLDSAARRAVADSLQPGDATVWEDPHFF